MRRSTRRSCTTCACLCGPSHHPHTPRGEGRNRVQECVLDCPFQAARCTLVAHVVLVSTGTAHWVCSTRTRYCQAARLGPPHQIVLRLLAPLIKQCAEIGCISLLLPVLGRRGRVMA